MDPVDAVKYEFREARDTLIDLLPLKSTYPIRNLPVRPERDIVPFMGVAYVVIDFSQPDVFYEVKDNTGRIMKDKLPGTGGSLSIETAELENEDYTFSVTASKYVKTKDGTRELIKQLLQTATVKTGVDSSVSIRPKRVIFEYHSLAIIVVEDAQRGNKYQLFDLNDVEISEAVESAVGGYLEIVATQPVKEDFQVKVVATNIKTGQTGVMDAKPMILVGPNVTLVPALKQPLIDYNAKGIVTLASTQTSVTYQLMYVDVDDEDLAIILATQPMLGVPVDGNGAEIELSIDNMTEDMTVRVLATKENGGANILRTQLFISVKPDPSKSLNVVEENVLPETGATIKVSNTQKGVLYQLLSSNNKPIGWPRFHSRNYGIGRARLEVNMAVGEFLDDSVYLPTGAIDGTTTFNVLAIKATTKVSVQLANTITVTI